MRKRFQENAVDAFRSKASGSRVVEQGQSKTATWSKKHRQLQYWSSKNTQRTVNADTRNEAQKIVDQSGVDQKLKVAESAEPLEERGALLRQLNGARNRSKILRDAVRAFLRDPENTEVLSAISRMSDEIFRDLDTVNKVFADLFEGELPSSVIQRLSGRPEFREPLPGDGQPRVLAE